jgi:hypothetical protein
MSGFDIIGTDMYIGDQGFKTIFQYLPGMFYFETWKHT